MATGGIISEMGDTPSTQDMETEESGLNGLSEDQAMGENRVTDTANVKATESSYNTVEAAKLASDSIRINMLTRIANSDGFFKSQSRDSPDLTFDEKYAIASDLLQNKLSTFLTRFGKFLKEEDLVYFTPYKNDYVISFQIKEIRQTMDSNKNQTKVRNRRYEAMKKLVEEGEYFGDEEIKSRDPLLYEQMVGQYLTPEEIQPQIDKSDLRFSTILLSHIDMIHNNEKYKIQTEMEECQMEESDEDEEEEEEKEEGEPSERISSIEKQMLRNEFVRTMQLRFLRGEDKDFDYSKVDNNVEYDSLDIREHDEEEKYFDDEDEESIHSDNGSAALQKTDEEIEDYETYEPKNS